MNEHPTSNQQLQRYTLVERYHDGLCPHMEKSDAGWYYHKSEADKLLAKQNAEIERLQAHIRKLESSSVETTGWYVEERLKDGTFRRSAMAHIWESNEDAHQQRDELTKRYPRKIFTVTSVRSAVEPTVTCPDCELSLEPHAPDCPRRAEKPIDCTNCPHPDACESYGGCDKEIK